MGDDLNPAPAPAATLPRRFPSHVMEQFSTVPWALTEEWMEAMRSIIAREHAASPEALEAYRARSVSGADNMQMRDGVAILPVRGPLFRYADFFSDISGATTYEGLMRDARKAADDPSVRSILLSIDSPGGEANGVAELASAIRAIDRGTKPVVAYVGGTGASAAYWIASAAREIVAADTAILGSIGVRMALRDTSERDARSGVRIVEFISSQSPNKRLDLASDDGRAKVQRTVDQLAAVFVGAVAQYRGVTAEDVVSKFGAGGVEVGADAVEVGLADRLGSFESLLAELATGRSSPGTKGKTRMSTNSNAPAAGLEGMVTKAEHDAAVNAAREEGLSAGRAEGELTGAKAAQARIGGILKCDEAKGRETLAHHLAFATSTSLEDAKATLAASPAAPAAHASGRAKDSASGLATSDVQDKPEPKAKAPVAIDRGGVYKKFSGGQ